MKPAPFDYVSPETVQAALAHLTDAGGDATILAGGQTLMPLLALRMSTPAILIDINRIAELAGVTHTERGTRVGATTRQHEILENAPLAAALPGLVTATHHVGHHQTRNRGTVGGSVSFGEPAAELPAVAVALGALIEIHSARAVRYVPADEFYIGPYSTVLEPDELVTAIHFPDQPAGSVSLFREVARRPGDFALVGLVGTLALDQGGTIRHAGIAWFGMGPTPIKARQAETALIGQDARHIDTNAIAQLAVADTDPFDDHHATAQYRKTVGRKIFARLLGETLNVRQA